MAILFLTILGLIFGSFANVYFYRLPENLSLWRPGSSCPACRKPIVWRDNIPVLSYLLLKGKCRFCGASISIRYPAIELAVGILFGAAAFKLQAQPYPVLAAFLFFILTVFLAGGIDLTTFFKLNKEYGVIPDHLSVLIILSGIAFSPFNPLLGFVPWAGLLNGVGAAVALAIFRWSAGKIIGREALGLGDVKIMAGVAAWLGWNGAVATLIAGSILGTLVSLPLIWRGSVTRKSAVPFGPFLSAGALGAFFFL